MNLAEQLAARKLERLSKKKAKQRERARVARAKTARPAKKQDQDLRSDRPARTLYSQNRWYVVILKPVCSSGTSHQYHAGNLVLSKTLYTPLHYADASNARLYAIKNLCFPHGPVKNHDDFAVVQGCRLVSFAIRMRKIAPLPWSAPICDVPTIPQTIIDYASFRASMVFILPGALEFNPNLFYACAEYGLPLIPNNPKYMRYTPWVLLSNDRNEPVICSNEYEQTCLRDELSANPPTLSTKFSILKSIEILSGLGRPCLGPFPGLSPDKSNRGFFCPILPGFLHGLARPVPGTPTTPIIDYLTSPGTSSLYT